MDTCSYPHLISGPEEHVLLDSFADLEPKYVAKHGQKEPEYTGYKVQNIIAEVWR